jgi:hypothetical protein
MSFLIYFAVLIVCAGSVLFGLDWMNSPLPTATQPPATHIAKVEPQAKPQAAAAPAKKVVRKVETGEKVPDAKVTAAKPMTPIFPTAPDKTARTVKNDATPAQQADAKSANANDDNADTKTADDKTADAKAQPAPAVPPSNGKSQASSTQAQASAPSNDTQANSAPAPQNNPPVAQSNPPAAQSNAQADNASAAAATAAAPGQCNVQACAAAYHSFRASDCTYQPFNGPRRVCGNPQGEHGGAVASAGHDNAAVAQRDARDDDDGLRAAAREVRRLAPRERYYADEDDGGPIAAPRSSRPAPFPFDFFRRSRRYDDDGW